MNKFNWEIDTPVHSAVMQALGGASVCWDPIPTGVFRSELASEIGEELLNFLQKKLWCDD